jgi:AcrR family transcriptional regulator
MITAKGARTRDRILDATAELVVANGVTNTGLHDVLAATGTSKSQLFHYFPDGKAELLATVEAREAARILEDQRPAIDHLDSWEAWDAWGDQVKELYRRKRDGCPVAALSGRTGRDPAAAVPAKELYTGWLAALQTGVEAMQAAGLIRPDADAAHLAMATLATVQGGAGMMQTSGSLVPLDVAVDASLTYLRSFAPPAT